MIEKRKVLDYLEKEMQRLEAEIRCQQKRLYDTNKFYADCYYIKDDYIHIDDPVMNAMLMEGL